MEAVFAKTKEKMEKCLTSLERDYSSVRAGRANPAVLDKVMVDYYGVPTPINQMAAVSVPEARLLVIQPWDASTLKDIEKAINYLGIQRDMEDMFHKVGDNLILYHFNADTNKVRVAVVWAFRNYYIAPYPEGTDPCDRMEDLFLRILIDDNYNITAKSIEKAIEFLEDVRDGVYDNLAVDEEETVSAGGTE